ncbi:MAG TPA: DUF177 domain-containing protein [Bacillota bacterium]
MRIDVGEIRKRRGDSLERDFTAEIEPVHFGGDTIRFTGPAHVTARVHNAGNHLWADVRVEGEAVLRCARCLRPIVRPLRLEYAEAFRRPEQAPLNDEQVRESVYTGETIDLGEGFVEQLLLELPMKTLCSEECRGLCPQCGQDLNEGDCGCERRPIDPRLVKLAEFFEKPDR